MIIPKSTQIFYKLNSKHKSLNPKKKYKPYSKYQNMDALYNMKHY